MRDIEIQYVAGCPNLSMLLERVEAVTCGQTTVHLHEIDPTGRVPVGFAGSPTLLVDGRNPFGVGDPDAGVTCTLRIPSIAELTSIFDGSA